MCTVTWRPVSGGYEVFMNRDELYSRGRALPPAIASRAGTRYIAPTDTDAGGTWIAANEHGITVCLLNYYHAAMPPAPADPRSRGQLVLDAVSLRDATAIRQHLEEIDESIYRPFTMLVFDRDGAIEMHQWDGRVLTTTAGPAAPITSSGYRFAEAESTRIATYATLVGEHPTHQDLVDYHRSHVPERGPYSVCVHRSDGGTRAFSNITVSDGDVTFAHKDGPACEDGEQTTVRLPQSG